MRANQLGTNGPRLPAAAVLQVLLITNGAWSTVDANNDTPTKQNPSRNQISVGKTNENNFRRPDWTRHLQAHLMGVHQIGFLACMSL